jgi:hypothetical protein
MNENKKEAYYFWLDRNDQTKDKQLASTNLDEARLRALNVHNKFRCIHNVSSYTISDTINLVAQNYAVHLASINRLVHSYNPRYGENLFYYCSDGIVTDTESKRKEKFEYLLSILIDLENLWFCRTIFIRKQSITTIRTRVSVRFMRT